MIPEAEGWEEGKRDGEIEVDCGIEYYCGRRRIFGFRISGPKKAKDRQLGYDVFYFSIKQFIKHDSIFFHVIGSVPGSQVGSVASSLTYSSGTEDSCSLSLILSVFEGLDFEVNGLGELGVVYLVRTNFSLSY